MKKNENLKELTTILVAAIVLAVIVSFSNRDLFIAAILSFLIILSSNTLTKKIVAYIFEIDVKISFWKMYQFGFRKDSHFKFPLPMLWLPLILALFSKGTIWFFALLEFDVDAKTERVSRRHGLYRFSQVTEWHIAWIATWGIITNIIMAIIGYSLGYEFFAKLSIYYAAWSLIPFSSLDGTKILFGSKVLWAVLFVIATIFFGWGLIIQI
ncbi:MAG: hypothetical protein IH845_02510 [Nanoarchaeota archaeon]|nr:hypothetical protein [Nanoarchaeota archaeon]